MSFSTDLKNELALVYPEKDCCRIAEIAGFVRTAGSVLPGRGGFGLRLATDIPAVARHYKKLFKDYFRIDPVLTIGESDAPGRAGKSGKPRRYMLTVRYEDGGEMILRETGMLLVKGGGNSLTDGIYQELIKTKCCRKAMLRGAFLGSGSMADPEKEYHLEFTVNSEILANDLRRLIRSFVDLSAKVVKRRSKYVVYMKKSAYIADTLALMGAHTSYLEMEELFVRRQTLNKVVRATNCDSANVDRAIDAAEKQIAAIESLKARGLYDGLPYKLREIAEVRAENPEASLTQLGEMLDPPLKKSGVNNRLKKLMELAGTL